MYVTADAQHIIVPWRDDLAAVIPQAKSFEYQGKRMLLVPNRQDEARVARNLGIDIPAPILTRYDWAGMKPWSIQKTTAALLTESHRAFVLSEFGTGKTRSVAWAAEFLRKERIVKRVLIAAPLSTLTPVWEAELFRVAPRAKVRVLHGSRQQRLDRLSEDADYYIINHHGLALLRDQLVKKQFDVFVIDELATFRNKQTKLWKAANAVVQSGVKFSWGLTGSPTPKAPTDAWAQVRLLTPNRVSSSFTRFRDQVMRQVSQFKWARLPNASQVVHDAMQPSVRFALSDVMELPPTIYQTRIVELEPATKKAYVTLFNRMAMITDQGQDVTAVNEGILQNKLLQVSLGYIYTDRRGVCRLPNDARLDAIREVVEESQKKVIVFVPFIHALDSITFFLQKVANVAIVKGDTPVGLRNKIFRAFQENSEPRVIVAHPGCMAHGLTLTSASTIVWAGPVNSYEIYDQANARIIRPGQDSKTLVVHIVGTPVERLCYQRLKDRASFQGLLLQLFKDQELSF